MNHRTIFILTVLGAALVLALGCEKKQQPDPFFEKWKVMAEQSQGHSPSPEKLERPDQIEAYAKAGVESPKEAAPPPELPTKPVTLKVRKASIVAVLQALARGADQSILIPQDVNGEISANLEGTPWDQAFLGILRTNGLTYAWEGNILRVVSVANLETNIKLAQYEKDLETQKIGKQVLVPTTAVIPIRYADAASLKEEVTKLLGLEEKGENPSAIEVDEYSNSLIVRAIPSDIQAIYEVVEKVDNPQRQIKIKAYIVEANRDTARELGVRWGGLGRWSANNGRSFYAGPVGQNSPYEGQILDSNGNVISTTPVILDPVTGNYTPATQEGLSGQGLFSDSTPGLTDLLSATNPAGLALSFMYGKIGDSILEAQLLALETEQKVNILSNPSILTLDNQVAYTENGTRVPYVSKDVAGNAEVKFVDAVLKLEIQPHIIDGKHLAMKIVVKNDEVDPLRNVQGNPYIVKKQTETKLITQDGETVVISGLTKTRQTGSDEGVPWFKDIPFLGYLFSTKGKSKNMEEVLIFITPQIMPEWKPGETQKTMEEIEIELQEKRKAEEEREDG